MRWSVDAGSGNYLLADVWFRVVYALLQTILISKSNFIVTRWFHYVGYILALIIRKTKPCCDFCSSVSLLGMAELN